MRNISATRKHSVFVAHCDEDDQEAAQYKDLLAVSGFSVASGAEDIESKIRKAHFFVVLISDNSLASDDIQRQLGLAQACQQETGGYRPIVIQVFAREANWRKRRTIPRMPLRDFKTGHRVELLSLDQRFDELIHPHARDALIAFMRPTLSVARGDIQDVETFNETDVFKLYADLFPKIIERDDPEDIEQWVLNTDVGTARSFDLPVSGRISYQLDSRYFILNVANKAVGLAFLTYDHSARLVWVNYIGMQRCWREGELPRVLFEEILNVLADLFPNYEGLILEVEPFDIDRVDAILKRPKAEFGPFPEEEKDEVRKFLRILFYHKVNCLFFVDGKTRRPLSCHSPCVDPAEDLADDPSDEPATWKADEADYWVMWCARPGTGSGSANPAADWRRAVHCMYVEILAKSLAERLVTAKRGEIAERYWQYCNRVVAETICRTRNEPIELRPFPDPGWKERWRSLGIDLPI